MPLGDFLCPFPLQHKQKVGCTHAGGTCLGHPGAPRGDEGVADPEPTLNSPKHGVMGTTPPTLLLGSSTPSPTLCIRSGSRTRTRTPPPLFSQPFFPPTRAPSSFPSTAHLPEQSRDGGDPLELSPSNAHPGRALAVGDGFFTLQQQEPHNFWPRARRTAPPCPQNPLTPPCPVPESPRGPLSHPGPSARALARAPGWGGKS